MIIDQIVQDILIPHNIVTFVHLKRERIFNDLMDLVLSAYGYQDPIYKMFYSKILDENRFRIEGFSIINPYSEDIFLFPTGSSVILSCSADYKFITTLFCSRCRLINLPVIKREFL
ncbi:hypothetical protein J4436_00025 [Candidatus Woesearchaeota archaeon]|nr:hypothetical protein [Candidatus Woesearchaeota archaeon]